MTASSVLVLEDDEVLRALLTEIIEETGEIVVAFASADEGLVFLESSRANFISLIVSDITMPGLLDGYELSRIVAVRWPSLKMILNSGGINEPFALGPNISFIAKPWTVDTMLRAISEALSPISP